MIVDRWMDLGELADRMGYPVSTEEAGCMRDVLMDSGWDGFDTGDIGEPQWIDMMERAVNAAALLGDGDEDE